MTLTYDLVVGERIEVIEHKAGRGLFNTEAFSKCVDGLDPRGLLLVGHLSGHVPDQVCGQVQSFYDVFRSVGLPCNGELDIASDLTGAIASGAVHLALGSAFVAVLLSMAVF